MKDSGVVARRGASRSRAPGACRVLLPLVRPAIAAKLAKSAAQRKRLLARGVGSAATSGFARLGVRAPGAAFGVWDKCGAPAKFD
jgi:hypothetical protein